MPHAATSRWPRSRRFPRLVASGSGPGYSQAASPWERDASQRGRRRERSRAQKHLPGGQWAISDGHQLPLALGKWACSGHAQTPRPRKRASAVRRRNRRFAHWLNQSPQASTEGQHPASDFRSSRRNEQFHARAGERLQKKRLPTLPRPPLLGGKGKHSSRPGLPLLGALCPPQFQASRTVSRQCTIRTRTPPASWMTKRFP
mmetsp:Transcript_66419/g.147577  ORF Transcript_66419/g.147577 Transcript_66419/m.147577 type:complete len:202 (-) Transcript_66419:230-835(-)